MVLHLQAYYITVTKSTAPGDEGSRQGSFPDSHNSTGTSRPLAYGARAGPSCGFMLPRRCISRSPQRRHAFPSTAFVGWTPQDVADGLLQTRRPYVSVCRPWRDVRPSLSWNALYEVKPPLASWPGTSSFWP